MIDLFGGSESAAPVTSSDPTQLLRTLAQPCRECRLGQTCDPKNRGLVCQGPITAEMAVLGDTPGFQNTSPVVPLPSPEADIFAGWLPALNGQGSRGIEMEDIFFINAVQCRTQKTKKSEFRLPHRDEVEICFHRRALPVLQSLPNLRLLVTLGMTAAAAVLGWEPEPKLKSHEGCWFGSDYLPGVAVFVLNHPRDLGREAEAREIGKLKQSLWFLRQEYFAGGQAKILPILAQGSAKRADQ